MILPLEIHDEINDCDGEIQIYYGNRALFCFVNMNFKIANVIISSLVQHLVVCGSIPPPPISERVVVGKCCPEHQYLNHALDCINENFSNDTVPWSPLFTDPTGKEKMNPFFQLRIGIPICGSTAPWPVYQYDDENSCDKLVLLADGTLRHYALEHQYFKCEDEVTENTFHQDYNVSQYCIDRVSWFLFSATR